VRGGMNKGRRAESSGVSSKLQKRSRINRLALWVLPTLCVRPTLMITEMTLGLWALPTTVSG
jgi:hypothetical protein